ncbi:hypothetical protein SAY87_017473 [Trapa incisa]|uniref:F-box domain-containing protein n=1 Tax=Trapa incisa TaxID=236973 RepID=A0AAN7QU39_9MYRT|nr:hypothetical protein SAY87_017473 [Trapa incisa]
MNKYDSYSNKVWWDQNGGSILHTKIIYNPKWAVFSNIMGGLISVVSTANIDEGTRGEGSPEYLDYSIRGIGLGDLPECCIKSILSKLHPLEICKLARLNRAFWVASTADNLWESKLPPNYMFLIERVLGLPSTPASCLTKKEIYSTPCRHNRFHDGSKVRESGISPADLVGRIGR